ncbi:CXXC-type zinc finger protein 1 [Mortierella sp. AD031]|nr:CXXC-type zinc finger protein 1 [Mortierella sp. AD031]
MSTKVPGPCVCGSSEDIGFMICCDECNSWMHGPCIKITKKFSSGIDDFFCPRCRPATWTTVATATSTATTTAATATEEKATTTPVRSKTRKRDAAAALDSPTTTSTNSPATKRQNTRTRRASPLTLEAGSVEQESSTSRPPVTVIIQTATLLKLSDEVLVWILIWVHCQKSICRVSSTCKRLWSVAQDPYLWKYITLHHDTILRRHWDTLLHPRLLSSNIYELNLVGEISSPVLIDTLKLDQFTGLKALRLEDIQTYTVYRLASKLPWLKVFEARRIKGNSDTWDWSSFRNLTQLEELLLWRNEKPMQTFSLSEESMMETPDDIYPEDGVNGGFGGFVQLTSNAPLLDSDEDNDDGDDEDEGEDQDGGEDTADTEGSLAGGVDDSASVNSNQSLGPLLAIGAGAGPGTGGSDDSGISIHPLHHHHQQNRRTRWRMMPQLKRLALINIVSPTTHRGTDTIMRGLVSRVSTFLYWNSFNILFPVVRTQYSRLVHLTLVEPCESAWREGTWQEHTAAFQTMKSLETITWINPHMQRRYLIPILDVLLSLDRLRTIRLISTDEDTQVLQVILAHVLETRWAGHLAVSIQDDLGSDPVVRDWCERAKESVRVANLDGGMKGRPLVFVVKLFRSEWDEDAGLKRLCLKAWQQTI